MLSRNKNGVDTVMFRDAGKFQDKIKTKMTAQARFVEGSPGKGVTGGRRRSDFVRFSKRFLDFLTCSLTIDL